MQNELNGSDEKDNNGGAGESSFADLFEESIKGLEVGQIVKGTVVDLNQDYVVVDIGYKSEGTISVSEFFEDDGSLNIAPGDEVEVYIVKQEDKNGNPILSRQKAKGAQGWVDIKDAMDKGDLLKGRITDVIKGGYFVEMKGLKAFLPGSQVDLKPVRDMNSLIGKSFDFKVLNVDRAKNNIIVSRRAVLEEERSSVRQETIKSIEEGSVLKGIVKNITSYGAFLDVGGIDGLLHITDISWSRVNHPSDVVAVGDEIDVKVLKFDREGMRLTLGCKQLKSDPWESLLETHPVGSKVSGKVVSIKDYGAFVQIDEGFEGLVHVSEMSWTNKVKHPSQILNVGDSVDVAILDVDMEKRRLSLGLKQVEPNPWDVIESKYPVGSKVKGKIKNITDFGVFIGMEEGIDGMIHVSDISWTKKINSPSDVYSVGDEVEASVIAIDREGEKFSLGIKQLEENPWDVAVKKFKKGTVATGEITSVTDFGVFIALAEGVEGLIRQADFGSKSDGNVKDLFKLGDEVTAEVVRVNKKERRIALSIEAYEKTSEKKALNDYVETQGNQTSSLGDILKDKLAGEGEE